ncbi:lysoplasmalogenase [Undibacterium sp.]|uniref:lysoplasmalogenase n=1 Tax=Undibacterium sp. TaxID=1914977 RepID=UPI00374D7A1C
MQTLLAAACAGLAITGAGAQDGTIWLHHIFKPLATLLILGIAWRNSPAVNPRYRYAVLAGITLSLTGDIFLMLPQSVLASGFLLGLASFLFAHLCFLKAFTSDSPLFGKPVVLLLLGLIGAANLFVLWPGLSAGLRLPVLGYVICLLAMSTQSITRHLYLQDAYSKIAAIGGLLFMLSDTLLAYNRFHTALPYSAVLVLGTYYPALWCIASSIKAPPSGTPAVL